MALHYMTQEGLDKLKKDLSDAIAQRPVIIQKNIGLPVV